MRSTKEHDPCDGQKPQRQTNGDDLRRALNGILSNDIFADVRRHGNVKWKPLALVGLAIFWVWSSQPGLVEAAKEAIATVAKLFGTEAVAVTSSQALTTALVRYTPQLLPALWARIPSLMPLSGPAAWRVGKWLPLAVDGSRAGVPRTQPNDERFNKPRKPRGKKKSSSKKRSRHAQRQRPKASKKSHYDPQAVRPQMGLTLLWHIGLRVPWCWKVGPSYSSERAHLETLLDELQPGWRDSLVRRRFLPSMTVSNALVTPNMKRHPVRTSVKGLYVAGDWVGDTGMLSDTALSSAREAAQAILAD